MNVDKESYRMRKYVSKDTAFLGFILKVAIYICKKAPALIAEITETYDANSI